MKRLLALVLLFSLLAGCSAMQESGPSVPLYFASAEGGLPQTTLVRRDFSYQLDPADPAALLDLLFTAPAPEGAVNYLDGCTVSSWHLEADHQLVLELSGAYRSLIGLDQSLADACLVRTLLENLPDIHEILLLREGLSGQEERRYTLDDLQLATLDLQPVNREITVWFPEEDLRFLEPEVRSVIVRENEELQRYVVEELLDGPKTQGLLSPLRDFPDLILSVSRDRDLCYVNLSSASVSSFHDRFQTEAMILFSIAQSLCATGEISAVHFLVDGAPQDFFCCIPIGQPIQGDFTLSGAPNGAAGQDSVTLYYPGPDGETLFPLERVVSYQGGISREQLALEALLSAPVPFWSTLSIPENSRVTRMNIQEGICYVEFSSEFLYQHRGTLAEERKIIHSIVATLTAFSAIDSVQFSIQGQLNASYQHFNFDAPLTSYGYQFQEE